MAYDQDMTDRGAVIYSRHNNHAGWGENGSDNEAASIPVEEYVPKHAPRFQEHFVLRNNETGELLAGVPYTIKTGDAKTFKGKTDIQGRTDVVWTDSPLPVEVNIEAVVEIKFDGDELTDQQRRAYWRIAGSDRFRLLQASDCECGARR